MGIELAARIERLINYLGCSYPVRKFAQFVSGYSAEAIDRVFEMSKEEEAEHTRWVEEMAAQQPACQREAEDAD